MKGKYQIVVGKNITNLLERMAKYEVFTLGGIFENNGVYTQSFVGELSKDAVVADEKKREAKVKYDAALKEKYAAKREEQRVAKQLSQVAPQGKNFKRGSPIDRDFQDRLDAGVIDSNGTPISPRARLAAAKKAEAVSAKAKKDAAKKETVKAKAKQETKGSEAEGFTVVEGVIPDDMK